VLFCTCQWFSDIRFDSNNEAAWNLIISICIPMENPDNYRTIVWKYLSYLYGLVSRCVIPTTCVVHELITLCSKLSMPHVGSPQNAKLFAYLNNIHPAQRVIWASRSPVTCQSSRPSVYELRSCETLTDRHIHLLVQWYGDLSLTIICHFLSDNTIIVTRRHSAFGIATRCGMNGPGFYSRLEKEIFTSPKPYRPALGPTQPPV